MCKCIIKQWGWICPKCESVMAPTERFCIFCSPQLAKEFSKTTCEDKKSDEPFVVRGVTDL